MDARMWHRQATFTQTPLPDPVPVEQFDGLPPGEQDAYWTQLSEGLPALVVPSVLTARAEQRLDRLVAVNIRRPPGAKSVIGIDAPFAVGKSTFVKAWAQGAYRNRVASGAPEVLPTWTPEPELSADWVPQVYITLRAASKIKDINASILAFLGYPSEGLVRVTTTRVVKVLATHGVRLLIVDDVHMLTTTHADGRAVLDYLKFLNTELGELGATMILVGAHLESGPLYQDPQIVGRLDKITLTPYEITTVGGRADWQLFLRRLEELLLPYFDTLPTGTFSRELAGHVWRRTQGYVGDTVRLVTEAMLAGFDDAQDLMTRDLMQAVALSARAAASEADLLSAAAAPSNRRNRKQRADVS
ncbi:TniB family NTP-binding protein [Ornithinimicrobium cavernae]|uniref:TniB family NTP-binding protein n=1 Tax=Ornithinimicrobium cavernae TaxID=2666047 RepID=UPI000D6882AD|nr:TniB family NTP-binding protein [Ornithinimicrobium cavernae]